MLYQSKYADLQVFIRSGAVHYHPATGVETHRTQPLRANFGHHSGEYMMDDPFTGQAERHAVIYGHFFDTDVAAEMNGWSEEERESVETTLDRLCKQLPFVVAKVAQNVEPLAPAPPWPTYDETHHKTIPVLAKQLGLVEETLAYEQATRNREGILSALQEQEEPASDEREMITL